MPGSTKKKHKQQTNLLQPLQEQLAQSLDNSFIQFLKDCTKSTTTREMILSQFKLFSSSINSATLLPDSDVFSPQDVNRIEHVAQYFPFHLNDCFNLVYGQPLCEKQKQLQTAVYNGYSRRHQHLLRKFGNQNQRAKQESCQRLEYLESIGTGPMMSPLSSRDFYLPKDLKTGLSKLLRISMDSLIKQESLELPYDEFSSHLSSIQQLLDFAHSKKIQSQCLHEFIQLNQNYKHSFFSVIDSNLRNNDLNIIRNMHAYLILIFKNYPFYIDQTKTDQKTSTYFTRVINRLSTACFQYEKKLGSLDKESALFAQPDIQMHYSRSPHSHTDTSRACASEDTFSSKSDSTDPLLSTGSSVFSSMDFSENSFSQQSEAPGPNEFGSPKTVAKLSSGDNGSSSLRSPDSQSVPSLALTSSSFFSFDPFQLSINPDELFSPSPN